MALFRSLGFVALTLLGVFAFSAELRAAEMAVQGRRSVSTQVTARETCLRWVWQEMSWYDGCWWQRHPYVGRSVHLIRSSR